MNAAPKSDSLDLLLGPMCNTFGVLVLVACITALVTQQPAGNRPRKLSATEELLQRRLEAAQGDLERLKALIANNTTGLGAEDMAKLAEIERLRKVLAALQEQSEDLEKKIASTAASNATDPGVSIRELKERERAAQREIDSLRNLIAALDEQAARLERRIQDLLRDRERAIESRTVKMRFPREHDSSLAPLQVIVRYGKVYPLRMADESLNPDVVRVPEGDDGFAMEPSSSGGWSIASDKAAIKEFISAEGSRFYFSIYVYPDSFETCRDFKQMILDGRREFGLKALTENYPLIFSSKGRIPPPPPL